MTMCVFKISIFTILLVQYVTQAEETVTPLFRKDYVYFKEQNAFYKYDKTPRKWSDALATCKAQSAELFVPKTKEELDQVIKTFEVYWPWIAAHDMFSEGDFITTDGKPLSDSYVKWRAGEPNNANNNEDCVILDPKGEYLDYPCDTPNTSVCRKSAVNLTQNIVCETYDTDYVYTPETDHCYKFHSIPKTWNQAYKICGNEESKLVIINSDAEAKILTIMLGKYPERTLKGNVAKDQIFVGFNDLLNHGEFLTIEGQTLSEAGYENWAPSQPDNANGNEHCGGMFRDGTLNDFNCERRAMFVCEKTLSSSTIKSPILTKLPDEQ